MADPKLAQLELCFPDIETDVLSQLLSFHDGSAEFVVAALLDEQAAEPDDGSAAAAVALQSEIDEQVARELQCYLEGEEKQRKSQLLETRAAAAATRMAATTKSLAAKHLPISAAALQRVVSRGRHKTGSVRLLDDQASGSAADAGSGEYLASSLSPEDVERYMPPCPRPSAEPAPAHARVGTPLKPSYGDAYSARVGRAREANRAAPPARPSYTPTFANLPKPPADLMAMPESEPAPGPWAELEAPPLLAPQMASLALGTEKLPMQRHCTILPPISTA